MALLRNLGANTASVESRVALVLSGCGVYDGSEIHEASAVMVHLSRHGVQVALFAPDQPQMHTVNHLSGKATEESRNVLVESARIARGNISPLSTLSAAGYGAVVFPGGFGAAKNLSTFAVDGDKMTVNKDVERVMREFVEAKKPVGLTCIAPVLAAKVLPGVELTVGHESDEGGKWPYAGTASAVVTMGAKHIVRDVTEVHVDEKMKVVTTPAFMCDAPLHLIWDGIGKLVTALVKLM
ncbi:hypothetical protein EMCRGX_G020319 [Ephydatia muelleri]